MEGPRKGGTLLVDWAFSEKLRCSRKDSLRSESWKESSVPRRI